MDKPEALRLAAELDQYLYSVPAHPLCTDAAAELRRLHAENERLAAEVANRNRRALDGDEAVSALANVHAYYEKLEAQRDVLLQALKALVQNEGLEPYSYLDKGIGTATAAGQRWLNARAAIKAVEEGK